MLLSDHQPSCKPENKQTMLHLGLLGFRFLSMEQKPRNERVNLVLEHERVNLGLEPCLI